MRKFDEGLRFDKHEKITWRCFEECLWRNHNEEYANWPISELQMKKRSPKLKFTRKTEQYRPLWKFWLLVKVNLSRVKVNGYMVRVGFEFSKSSTNQAAKTLTHPNDVALTWTKADMDVLAWLLTWSDDIIRWRQMTSVAVFRRVAEACDVCQRVEEKPETWEVLGGACEVEWRVESQVL